MRDLKFRAWDKERNLMVYDFAIVPTSPTWSASVFHDTSPELHKAIQSCYEELGQGLFGGDYSVLDFSDWYGIHNYEIMQYTGMKDTNGVDVYEGDVLRWISSNPFSLGEVRTVKITYTEARYWCTGSVGVYLAELLVEERCEVIGNIYENTGLLK